MGTRGRPDYAAVTADQRRTWSAGDYSVVGRSVAPAAEALVAAADPHAGQRVLDVACGSGNVALVAARRYCEVAGVDYVPALLERARRRASAEGLTVRFQEGDAQALPFEDAAFDCVLSAFGVMFAPDQAKAADELVRVCRPGGTLALACWTPEGTAGDFFAAVARYAPPPPGGLERPTRWGTEQGLRELLGEAAASLRLERRIVSEHFLSVQHALEVFRTTFGPTQRAFAALDAEGQRGLASDLGRLFREKNRATDGTLVFPIEYLEAVVSVP